MLKKTLLGLAILSFLTATISHAQTTRYVSLDGDDVNNGSSWSTAFKSLQPAINASSDGDFIYVEKGEYQLPSSIIMKEGVKMYGSFAGTETSLGQRDISDFANNATKATILKGNGSSRVIVNNFNASTIMTEASILDGFVLTNGREPYEGAGIYNNYVSAIFRNLIITGNIVQGGDAGWSDGSSGRGGGVFNYNSSPKFINVIINDNKASAGSGYKGGPAQGGGMFNYAASPELINVSISGNSVFAGNGYNASKGNHAWGGGIYNANSNPKLVNVTIAGNTVHGTGHYPPFGAGMTNHASTPKYYNSIVMGGIDGTERDAQHSFIEGLSDTTNNNIDATKFTTTDLFTNFASGDYSLNNTAPVVNTGSNLLYTNAGGNLSTDKDAPNNVRVFLGTPTVDIIDIGAYELQREKQTAPSVELKISGSFRENQTLTASYTFTDVEEDTESGSTFQWYRADNASGSGKAAIAGATSKTYALTGTDLNKYISFEVIPDDGLSDILEKPTASKWIQINAPIAMGASNILYVNKNVSGGTKSGNSWNNAIPELAEALEWAHQNRNEGLWNSTTPLKVWVANGTYKPLYSSKDGSTYSDDGRDNAFILAKNVQLYGNFVGTETSLSDRGTGNPLTILSGDIGTADNNTDNSYHVVVSTNAVELALIDGFIIKNGNANGVSSVTINGLALYQNSAGGLYFYSSSPVLRNVLIVNNTATYGGGGLVNITASPTLINVTISENTASTTGGGMYNDLTSNPKLYNTLLLGNTAPSSPGIYSNAANSTPDIQHSLIQELSSTANGNINATGIVSADVFTNPTNGDFSSKMKSKIVNAGSNSLYTAAGGNLSTDKDIAGEIRKHEDIIDIGAYESQIFVILPFNFTLIQPLNGTPGETITLYGIGFDALASDNTVTFIPVGGGAGTTATVTAGSTTKLSVTVPSITGGNYTISIKRASDNSIKTTLGIFGVSTSGGYFGSVGANEHVLNSSANYATSVYAVDMDSDGDIDVVSGARNSDQLTWYENDGNESFTKHVISTATTIDFVSAADIDGDGDMDLMITSIAANEVAWYKNDGSQNFTKHKVNTTIANYASSVYAADLDGDGDLDLMSASIQDNKIAWYENDGNADPAFTEHVVTTTALGATSIYAADVDGDGDIDMMSANQGTDHKIAWYENDGAADPTFTERVVSTTAHAAVSVYAADVDGDGDLDLMSACFFIQKLAWYENDGGADPTFTEHVVPTTIGGVSSVHSADLDGDGDMDLISVAYNGGKMAWYENDGAASPTFTEHKMATQGSKVFAADIDSDGDIDLLLASTDGNKIAWYDNRKVPVFITQTQPLNGTSGTPITIYGSNFGSSIGNSIVKFTPVGGGSSTVATVTAASNTKLTVTVPALTGGNYKISIKRSTDDQTTTSLELFSVPTSGGYFGVIGSSERGVSNTTQPTGVYAADVDGDGDMDLLSASYGQNKISWHENNGNQSFTERVVSTNAKGAESVFAADVDGDGDMDLMSASSTDDTIAWYENNGSQSFTQRFISTTADFAFSVYAADVDGDGDLDIMSASRNDNKIAWYENDGGFSPTFTERIVSTNALGASFVFAADVDGDGDIDLMSGSFNDSKVAWYENNGATDPTFTEHVVSTSANGATQVYAVDVDGDGDLDLMSASRFENKIRWYESDGATVPAFTEHVITTTASGFRNVFAADVDGDGDIDLMSASYENDKFAWYKNDGSENFTEQMVSISADYATSIYATDIDGDGDIDLMSALFYGNKIAWYENKNRPALSITQMQPLNSAPGTSIVFYGNGFDPVTTDNTVTFTPVGGGAGTTATVTAVSDNKLTVTVPVLAGGNYKISVKRAVDNTTKTLLDFFSVSTPAGNFGTPGSNENVISSTITGATGVYAADVDGDGDMDVVTASYTDNKIAWHENNGGESFTVHTVSSNANGAESVYAADLDGDGDIDLLSASANDDKIAWYENDGSQNFTEHVVSTTADFAYNVYASDVDGDGDVDILSASFTDGKIAWYENDGATDPTFTEHVVTTSASGATNVYVADIDDDGDMDIVSASSIDKKIAWYENNGSQSFTKRDISTTADGASQVYSADMDGDGDIDIVSSSANNDKIAWYENDGSENFTERIVSSTTDGANSVFVADLDGDGDIDILSASASDNKIVWYENDGATDPTFKTHIISSTATLAWKAIAADMDGDGVVDVVSASFSDNKIVWYKNGKQPFGVTQTQTLSGIPGASIKLYGFGFDASPGNNMVKFTPAKGGAGTTATVSAANIKQLTVTVPAIAGGNYKISLKRGSDNAVDTLATSFAIVTGGGAFGAAGSSEHIVRTDANQIQSVHAADVDGDGDMDLLSASEGIDEIAWYENNGTQTFTKHVVSTNAYYARDVFAADVDGDGDIDLLSASAVDQKIAWYKNDGAQNFTEQIITETADGANSVFAADLDGDGDIDIMSASSEDDKIRWFENNGSQSFTEHVVSSTADGAFSVFAIDVDGDGDMDLLSASSNDDKIAWYENDGSQNFTVHVVSTTADFAHQVYAADLDGDGDIDLMSASQSDKKIAWYKNDGSQNFTEQVVTITATGARSVYAADMDGDGHIDILSATAANDKIAWYRNDGASNPTFSEMVISTSADGAISVFAADIDGDGNLDVISGSETDNKLAWYSNKTQPTSLTNVQYANGAPGSSITLYGLGFDSKLSGNTVAFIPVKGGSATNATINSGTRTKLKITVPTLDGGNYTISVKRNSTNSPDTSSTIFTVVTSGGSFGADNSSENIISESVKSPISVYAVDMDGDGDMDLVLGDQNSNGGTNKISWFKNDGTGIFTEHVVSTTVSYVSSVYAADVDDDGDIDIMSASIDDSKISWFENDGSQSFTEHVVITDASEASSVYAADLDGDGDLDLMSASKTGTYNIAWYKNDGSQNFTKQVVSTNAAYANSVYAADVDGDGDIDMMSASSSGDKIAWYENDGAASPTFTERLVSNTADGASYVYAYDVDGDGDMDLMSASFSDNKIAWYENNGAQAFTERVVSTTATGANSVGAADLDGDGDIDLFSTSSTNSKIAWYENDGSQIFTERIITTAAYDVAHVVAADIDADGDLDLIAAIPYNPYQKVAWYENGGSSISTSGRSLTFDGNADYVEVPDNNALDITKEFTIEAWVKTALDVNPRYIIHKEDAYGFGLSSDYVFFNAFGNLNYTLAHTFTTNTWVHLAVVMDSGNDATFYINGVNVGTVAGTSSVTVNTSTLKIGGNGASETINGSLDEIRIWNTERTGSQIQKNVFQSLSENASFLVAYFPFNEESGSVAKDLSSTKLKGLYHGNVNRNADTHPFGTLITGNQGWRLMSSPAEAATYSELLETLWTQGFTGADVEANGSNVIVWNESTRAFESISSASLAPAKGKGFAVFVYNDNDGNTAGVQGGFPKIIQSDKNQATGTVTPAVTFTSSGTVANDGWNLVGNPYGSTLDWDASSGLSSSNLDAAIYVWSDAADAGNGSYLSWNGAAGTLATGLIAPAQGFWVKANAASPALTLTDEARSNGGVLLKKAPVPLLTFSLANNALTSQALFMFSEQSSVGKDRYDTYKLQSLNPNYLSFFSMLEDGTPLEINALPTTLAEVLDIPFDINGSNLTGNFELSWDVKSLPADWRFILIDTMEGTELDLLKESSFEFELDNVMAKSASHADEANVTNISHGLQSPSVLKAKSGNQKRFILRIVPAGVILSAENSLELPTELGLAQNYPNPFNPSTTISFALPQAQHVSLEVFDVTGRRVATLVNESRAAGKHEVRFNASRLSSGMYFYRLSSKQGVITKKLLLIK